MTSVPIFGGFEATVQPSNPNSQFMLLSLDAPNQAGFMVALDPEQARNLATALTEAAAESDAINSQV